MARVEESFLMVPPRTRKRARPAADAANAAPPAHTPHPELPVSALRRYIKRYGLPVNEPVSLIGYLGSGRVGSHSASSSKSHRSTPQEARAAVETHMRSGTVREGDTIAEFLYALEHRREAFKLNFGELHHETGTTLNDSVNTVVTEMDEQHQAERKDKEPASGDNTQEL